MLENTSFTRRATISALFAAQSGYAQSQKIERLTKDSLPRIRVLGGAMQWLIRPADTGGIYFLMLQFVPPGAGVPPHQHAEYEAFCVTEGEVEFAKQSDGVLQWTTAKKGDTVSIPGEALHSWRNTSGQPAQLLVSGAGRLGQFFEEAGIPVKEGETVGPPTPDEVKRVMAVVAKYGYRFAPR